MLHVSLVNDPFDPFLTRAERHDVEANSPRQALEMLFPGFQEFAHPTICFVNGEISMRSAWDAPTTSGSHVSFVRLAQGVTELIILAIVLIVAVVVALVVLQQQPPAAIGADDQSQQNGDTVYTLSGQQNQNKLNNSVECPYGKNRIYPSYAALPYSLYKDNDSIQFSLFCIGHGEYDFESPQFEETSIDSYADVEIEIVPPGGEVTLFHTNVHTSAAVANIELYAPTQEEYHGWTPAFVVNEAGTQTNQIQVDISFPSGLYVISEGGTMEKKRVKVRFEYRSIDNAGDPLGAWVNFDDIEVEKGTLTPQRFTIDKMVTLGRYEMRAKRRTKKDEGVRSGDLVKWESMRCFIPDDNEYGDVTLIAVKAKATGQLNNNSASRFNVVATRKLPTWTEENGWSIEKQPTRNPVWAFCDIFRGEYGGFLSDSYLDMATLFEMAGQFETDETWFDYIFDQGSTVWAAATVVARVGRGIPMLVGSQISIVLSEIKTTATAVFNQHNIVEGSFNWEIKLPSGSESDGIEVEYMDAETWLPETVLCLLGDDAGNHPQKLKIPGITDRTRAFQEGLYERATQLYNREAIEFKTGLEGHIPQYGDLILVSHDVPRWGVGGLVEEIDGTSITLSKPVTFLPDTIYKLYLRKKDGSAYGPVTVESVDDPTTVNVSVSAPPPDEFYIDDTHERPYFLFGVEEQECKRCIVVGLHPDSDDAVTISCAAYDERLFSYGEVPTPDRYAPAHAILVPSAPLVTAVFVKQHPDSPSLLSIYWPPALGAVSYIVETSSDGEDWTRVTTTTVSTAVIEVTGDYLHIRVAGVNVGVGAYAYWEGYISLIAVPIDVTDLVVISQAPGIVTIGWSATPLTDTYVVTIHSWTTGRLLRTVEQSGLTLSYTSAMGSEDGMDSRSIVVKVKGKNAVGTSETPAILNTFIPAYAPEQPEVPDILTWDNAFVLMDTTNTTFDHT